MKNNASSNSASLPGSELVPIIQEILSQGGSFVLAVTGSSMSPALRHMKDKVELVSPGVRRPKVGDIVLFQRTSEDYVLHRIIRERKGKFTVNGDAQSWTEIIAAEQIIGVVQRAEHRGRWISCDSIGFRIRGRMWGITRPFRPMLFRIIRGLRQHRI